MSFDPWGARRDPFVDPFLDQAVWQQWGNPSIPGWAEEMLGITPRGFTGHEHLDWHGIIHMNGRIYDPHLGRFLQADPFMEDTGTLNRYTYVHNNPLAYTDPSGYISVGRAFRMVAAIAVTAVAPYLGGSVYATMAAGAASGALATGSVEGALWGAFSGAVFWGIGDYFQGVAHANAKAVYDGSLSSGSLVLRTGLTSSQFAAQTVSHGIAGGVISEMQGGKFGHGFISAGMSKAVTPGITHNIRSTFGQFVAISVLGGTISRATGGKFANGAATAAMSYALSQIKRGRKRSLGDGEGSLAFEEVTLDEVNSTLERLREFPEFAETEAKATKIHGELRYVLGEESAFHNGLVIINRNLRGTSYTTNYFPPGVEGMEAEIAWELSADVSSASGVQVPFTLERIIFHEVSHGVHRSGFHSEHSVINPTNDFMRNHFSELPRADHRIHNRDLR